MNNKKSIDDKLNEFKPGQEAFFHEDGEICRVKVLKAYGDKEAEKYELEILEVVCKSKIVVPSEVGYKFDCYKLRKVGGGGNWYLTETEH